MSDTPRKHQDFSDIDNLEHAHESFMREQRRALERSKRAKRAPSRFTVWLQRNAKRLCTAAALVAVCVIALVAGISFASRGPDLRQPDSSTTETTDSGTETDPQAGGERSAGDSAGTDDPAVPDDSGENPGENPGNNSGDNSGSGSPDENADASDPTDTAKTDPSDTTASSRVTEAAKPEITPGAKSGTVTEAVTTGLLPHSATTFATARTLTTVQTSGRETTRTTTTMPTLTSRTTTGTTARTTQPTTRSTASTTKTTTTTTKTTTTTTRTTTRTTTTTTRTTTSATRTTQSTTKTTTTTTTTQTTPAPKAAPEVQSIKVSGWERYGTDQVSQVVTLQIYNNSSAAYSGSTSFTFKLPSSIAVSHIGCTTYNAAQFYKQNGSITFSYTGKLAGYNYDTVKIRIISDQLILSVEKV